MILRDKDVLARIRALEEKVSQLQDDGAWDGFGPGWRFYSPVPYSPGPKVRAVVKLLAQHLGLDLKHVPSKGEEWELVQVKSPPNKRMKLTPRKQSRKSK